MMNSFISKLPYDLQYYVYQYVQAIRAPISVLTDELKRDIESYQLIGSIERNYKQVFPNQSTEWMNNAFVNILNDNRGFQLPLNVSFHRLFPNLADEEIKTKLNTGNHSKKMWTIMAPSMRKEMYDISCAMLVHYI